VIYLIPECSIGPFRYRLKLFHLMDAVREERVFVRTLSANGRLSLDDQRLLRAANGADIFLDTAIRFMKGNENAADAEQREFAELLFALLKAGARTINGAHHSPKSFAKDEYMSLENVLRGSGDIGAMLSCCWGISQTDRDSNSIYVMNVKARDFEPEEPFVIQGRNSIDQSGYFDLINPPGTAGSYADQKKSAKPGRPVIDDRDEKQAEVQRLKDEGKSYREIEEELDVKKTTAWRLLKEKGYKQ
jgi:hypothetical protein